MSVQLTDKKSLREQCLAARKGIDALSAQAAGAAVTQKLLALIPSAARIVAGYRAVNGEIDISDAFKTLGAKGHTLCLPVVEETGLPLFFRRWQWGQPLVAGRYGIDIPPDGEPHLIPDAVVVPLLAFDRAGGRLGYGAGYYDRTIRALRRSQKKIHIIGAAYGLQKVDTLPRDAHDEMLDTVVTEKEVIRIT